MSGSGTTSITTTVADDSHNHSNYLIRNSHETTSGYIQAGGFIGRGGSGLRVSMPDGASYHTTTPSVTGAWKIKLPQSMSSTMMRMTIKIYDYSTNESFEVSCGGYNYNGNSNWYNEFAYIVASPKVNKDLQVRFGHDGSYACIWIGETNSTWDYPQVFVTDFQAGYNAFDANSWNDGWTITVVTSFDTVTDTVTNTQIGRYVDNNIILHAGNYGSYANLITNNNQLTNGANYITDGNTNWDNSYGFITASSTETLSNKSGNISQWTNNSNYATQAYRNSNSKYCRFCSRYFRYT